MQPTALRTYCLQDYTTITSGASVTSIKQSGDEWLELTGARDVIFYLHAVDGTTSSIQTVTLETSPTADDELFAALTSVTLPAATSSYGKIYQQICRAQYAAQPPASFLRWNVSTNAGGAWNLTFRIFVSINFIRPDFSVIRGGQEIMSVP